MAGTLIDRVIQEIKDDIEYGDVTAIAELLKNIPQRNLIEFLPEEEWEEYENN